MEQRQVQMQVQKPKLREETSREVDLKRSETEVTKIPWWLPWYCEGNVEELSEYYVPETIFKLSRGRKAKDSLMDLQKLVLHQAELSRIYDFRVNMTTEEEMEAADWAKYNAPQLLGTIQSKIDRRVYCYLRVRGAQKLCIPF